MRRMNLPPLAAVPAITLFLSTAFAADLSAVPEPAIEWSPRTYLCCRPASPIVVDGTLADAEWANAPWTSVFVDIEGGPKPAPRFRTRAKMLWDDRYLYVAAELEEPDVWGTLRERDSVVYRDNDFEVFIDPDGDTHEYYELEVNALGTVWDLLLVKPYRDGGPAVDAWDIQGLLVGVAVDGTLNHPGDEDRGWTVEIAIPWAVLDDCAHRPAPPHAGDRWRMNCSRVEWRTEVRDGRTMKSIDPGTGEPLPEDNWVWSPQGLVAMHYPEMWGIVEFTDEIVPERIFVTVGPDEAARWVLMRIYYRERRTFTEHGAFTSDLSELGSDTLAASDALGRATVAVTPERFEARLEMPGGRVLHISEDGHLW